MVSRWEGALDTARAKKVLGGEIAFVPEQADEPGSADASAAGPEEPKSLTPAASESPLPDAPSSTARE